MSVINYEKDSLDLISPKEDYGQLHLMVEHIDKILDKVELKSSKLFAELDIDNRVISILAIHKDHVDEYEIDSTSLKEVPEAVLAKIDVLLEVSERSATREVMTSAAMTSGSYDNSHPAEFADVDVGDTAVDVVMKTNIASLHGTGLPSVIVKRLGVALNNQEVFMGVVTCDDKVELDEVSFDHDFRAFSGKVDDIIASPKSKHGMESMSI